MRRKRGDIVSVMRFLRDDPRCLFWNIVDVTAVDWPGREQRFDVVYHLLSPKHNVRVRVKIAVDEDASVRFDRRRLPGVDWFEREIFDLYGVVFTGHPDMRRILTDYGLTAIRCARTFRSPALSKCVTTTNSSAWSTRRCGSLRNSATSIFSRPGKAPNTCCRATRRRRQGTGGGQEPRQQGSYDEGDAQAGLPIASPTRWPRRTTVPHTYPECSIIAAMPKVFATGFMIILMECDLHAAARRASRCRRGQRRRARRCQPSRGDADWHDRHGRCRVRADRRTDASLSG